MGRKKSKKTIERPSIVENDGFKVGYASMIKWGTFSLLTDAPYKIVRVVADVDFPSA